MGVPYKVEASPELLVDVGSNPPKNLRASEKIPAITLANVSERLKTTLDAVQKFVEEECIPAEPVYAQQTGAGVVQRSKAHPQIVEDLKSRARELGLWNMFLPKRLFPDESENFFTGLEYGLIAEVLGRSTLAPEATNCAAPDTGNMELLAKYGTQQQKDLWLRPLLEGQIRSSFMMTEPGVASSDAKNIELEMRRSSDGKEWVLNGSKWTQSGTGDVRNKIYIVFGRSNPENDKSQQHSVILIPRDTPRITVKKFYSVYRYDNLSYGYRQVVFKDV